jgi:hypothetical protein
MHKILVGFPEVCMTLEGIGVDLQIILTWIIGRQVVRVWPVLSWLRMGSAGGLLTQTKPFSSNKATELVYLLKCNEICNKRWTVESSHYKLWGHLGGEEA